MNDVLASCVLPYVGRPATAKYLEFIGVTTAKYKPDHLIGQDAWARRTPYLTLGRKEGSIKSMTVLRKVKISISLSEDLVACADKAAQETPHATRSSVIENWVRHASRLRAAKDLEHATIAYYESLNDSEALESKGLGKAASKAARKLRF